LSPPGMGQQKIPKSAVLVRDTPGLSDCSLMTLHMATCLSQLDGASPKHRGDSQKTLLHQTHSALEPSLLPCQGMPRCTLDAHQHNRPRGGEWSCGVDGYVGHLGLQQGKERLQDHLEIFRYPQALGLGKGVTMLASSCGPGVPGKAPHPSGEER
ncbi:hypothetical protein N330_10229, partial [Leptosomus discolor]